MRAAIAITALVLSSAGAQADECDVRAAALIRQEHASLDRRATMKIFLALPPIKDLAVECWPSLGVSAAWAGKFPPQEFFAFIGRAGAIVMDLGASSGERQAIACHAAALRSDDVSSLDFRDTTAECAADNIESSVSIFKKTKR